MENHGGHREGAGRKPKADELKLENIIREAMGTDGELDLWKSVYQEAVAGSARHTKIITDRLYGYPHQAIAIKGDISEILLGAVTMTLHKPEKQNGKLNGVKP